MTNTLTNLAPVLYSAMQIVPREQIGFITASNTNFDDKGAAQDAVVKVPVFASKTTGTYTPGMTTTAGTDATPTTVSVTLDTNTMSTFNLTGEQEQYLSNGGDNAKEFLRQQTEQAIRAVTNEIENALAAKIFAGASRAYGTAGTAPFGATLVNSNNVPATLKDAAGVKKILKDNGIPVRDGNVSLILDSNAVMNLGAQVTLNNNSVGSVADTFIKTGIIANIDGMAVRESGFVQSFTTASPGTNYAVNYGSGYAKGSKTIVTGTGTGTISANDLAYNYTLDSGAVYKYVVKTGGATCTSLVINGPGLMQTWADTNNVRFVGSYTGNIAMHRNAAVCVVRAPIIPDQANIQQIPITDPVSGLTLLLCRVVGDGMVTYRVHALYATAVVQEAGIAILLG